MPAKSHLRRAAVAIAAAVCAVLTLASCTGATGQEPSGDGQGFISGGGTATVVKVGDRETVPDIEGVTLQDEPLALSGFGNDVVVVNVWASWCAPCRAEAETLREVAAETAKDGVSFVGLNTQDNKAGAIAFERNYKPGYPSLFDQDGQLLLQFESVPPGAIPSTLIIDREGRVAARVLGETTYNQLTDLVDGVVAEGR